MGSSSSTPRLATSLRFSVSSTRFMMFLGVTPGTVASMSWGSVLKGRSSAVASRSSPARTAAIGSGSSCWALRRSKISAVSYGELDQMMRSLGNASVRSTSLLCRSLVPALAGLTLDRLPERSANGSSVKLLFWSNSIRSIGDL